MTGAEDAAAWFGIVWFAAIIAGLFFIIRPVRSWPPVATRVRALLVLIAVLIVPPFGMLAFAPDMANAIARHGKEVHQGH